tara:strand:+ start:3612 stop:4199 length:588 start_codon:yes stop_codon:yes gene_type:complete
MINNNDIDVLDQGFYSQDASEVAKMLLGKRLVRQYGDIRMSGRIVETEAYYGETDPPSRAYKGYNNFARLMWDRPGTIFIYMVHANWLMNIVTMEIGTPSAVLIRAIEPLEGIDVMNSNRYKHGNDLTNGPGKLTEAMMIDKSLNGSMITGESANIHIENSYENISIVSSNRIGVSKDLKTELRFFEKDNKFVSR